MTRTQALPIVALLLCGLPPGLACAQTPGAPVIDPAKVAFGYTDTTGTKLLALAEADDTRIDATIDARLANTLVTAVCSEGELLTIRYLRMQQRSPASNGRQTDGNFANDRGQLFEVVTGEAGPDDTCMLVPAGYLGAFPVARNDLPRNERETWKSAYWRSVAMRDGDRQPADVFRNQLLSDFARTKVTALEQAKARPLRLYWPLHRSGSAQEVAAVEFTPDGDSLLGSLVLVEPEVLSFMDMPASVRKGQADGGCWRVDDECRFGAAGMNVQAVLGTPGKQLVFFTTDGPEGKVILLLQAGSGVLRELRRAYRYHSPL